MKKLEGKVAIITGGSSGIGLGMAYKFSDEGAEVVIVGRNEDKLIRAKGDRVNISYVAGDMTKTEDIEKVISFVKEKYRKLDILVNNAGWCPVARIDEITIEDYDKAFNLDVRAVVEMTINALPLLKESKGNIINISSVGATHRTPTLSMYQGAKIAIENFTKVWALELIEDGIRVNCIAPGAIESDIWNVPGLTEEQSREHRESIEKNIPIKRFGRPEEVANVALFLVSDDASYVSGSVYNVDGAQGAF